MLTALRCRLGVWLAVVVTVFAALAPLLPGARAGDSFPGAMDVCTAMGLPNVPGAATGDAGDSPDLKLSPGCAWCLIALDLPVPPPDLSLPALLPPEAQAFPRSDLGNRPRTLAGYTPPPRGPPELLKL
jgi:hypothetical protein